MYRNYDQQGLDAQYNLRERFPNFQEQFDNYDRESERVRGAYDCRLDLAYGDAPGERLDVFPSTQPKSPVQIFIHGGYWQALDKTDFSFVAAPLVDAECAAVILNYDLAPNVTMDEIVRQVCAGVAWTHRNAESFGGNRDRIHVSGHSAGGHLAAMVLGADWGSHEGIPATPVIGGCVISGIFDLEPIRLSYQNPVLNLDDASTPRNSPIRHVPDQGVPLIVTVGSVETDEFLRQSQEYSEAWRKKGHPAELMELDGHDHFTIVEEMGRSDTALTQAILKQMDLK